MKPCAKNRKLIAWQALGVLDARRSSALRDHLDHCEGCRRYWEEVSNVTQRLASAAPESDLEASEYFHHRVVEKLQSAESSSVLQIPVGWLRGSLLNWRVALPLTGVLVIALVVMVAPRHPPAVSLPAPATVQVGSPSTSSDLAPTIANYQMVASQSLEQLDELLTRQGNKSLPPGPVYTASSLAPANESF
jgi:anti-sigma factor RsiW